MNQNPYLATYPQSEVESLTTTGSIEPNVDENTNLVIEINATSMYSSSITIPLVNIPTNSTKVETKYQVDFTEL